MADKERGRPTIMTDEVIQKLREAFLLGCTDLEACLVANINKATLYRYQDEHPEFVEEKEMLKKTPTLKARTTVVKDIATNPDLALKYLERKEKDEFSSKSEINTNLTFTQMSSIVVKDGGDPKKPGVKLEFNIGDKKV